MMRDPSSTNGHLLTPESMLGIPVDYWIYLFAPAARIILIVYCCSVTYGESFNGSIVNQPLRSCFQKWSLSMALIVMFSVPHFRLLQNPSEDPTIPFLCIFLAGLVLEVLAVYLPKPLLHRRPSLGDLSQKSNNSTSNPNESKESVFLNRRFSWFLLYAGSTAMASYGNILHNNDYEYRGPMRITQLPQIHNMNKLYGWMDECSIFSSCLDCSAMTNRSVPASFVQATIEIGWGHQWACQDLMDQDRWNTNWPIVPECTSFVCEDPSSIPRYECTCYNTYEEARKATRDCMEQKYDFSLHANETFDRDQPPWEDPTWPSITRYGKCDGNVGTSMDVEYVDKCLANGHRHKVFGVACLTAWLVLLVLLWRKNQPPADSNRKLWSRLFHLRTKGSPGQTVVVGQPVPDQEEVQALVINA